MISPFHSTSILLVIVSSLFAQYNDTALFSTKAENYFRLKYDNDFFSATDRYYTQGIVLDFIHPLAKRSPLAHCLIKVKGANKNYYGLHLEQDVFTPISIRYKGGQIYYGERPFTAVFFLSHTLTSINTDKNHLLATWLDLGVLGPWAKGEEEQKGIHKALDNIAPQGWENQLSTDIILNYRARFEKAIIHAANVSLSLYTTTRLGTLYTDAGFGTRMQCGVFSSWHNCLAGTNSVLKRKKTQAYVFLNACSRIVGYNATLQGGLTNSGNIYALSSASVNRLVAEVSAGIVLTYKRLGLEYSKYYITPEFKKGVDHGWGSCVISLRF